MYYGYQPSFPTSAYDPSTPTGQTFDSGAFTQNLISGGYLNDTFNYNPANESLVNGSWNPTATQAHDLGYMQGLDQYTGGEHGDYFDNSALLDSMWNGNYHPDTALDLESVANMYDPYAFDYGNTYDFGEYGEVHSGPQRNVAELYSDLTYASDSAYLDGLQGKWIDSTFAGNNNIEGGGGGFFSKLLNTPAGGNEAQARALAKRQAEGFSESFMPVGWSESFEDSVNPESTGFFSNWDENKNIVDGVGNNAYDSHNRVGMQRRYTGGADAPFKSKSVNSAYTRFLNELGSAGSGDAIQGKMLNAIVSEDGQSGSLVEVRGLLDEANSGIIYEGSEDGTGDPILYRDSRILSKGETLDQFKSRMSSMEASLVTDYQNIKSNKGLGVPGQVGVPGWAQDTSGGIGKVFDRVGDYLFKYPAKAVGKGLKGVGSVLGHTPLIGDNIEGFFGGAGDSIANFGTNLDEGLGSIPHTLIDTPAQMIRGGYQAMQGNPAGKINMVNAGGNFLNETVGRGIDLATNAVQLVTSPLMESGLNLGMTAGGGSRPTGGSRGSSARPKGSSSVKQSGGGTRGDGIKAGGSAKPARGSSFVEDPKGNSHDLSTAGGQMSYQRATSPGQLNSALAALGGNRKIGSDTGDFKGGYKSSKDLFKVTDTDKSDAMEVASAAREGEYSPTYGEEDSDEVSSKIDKLYEELGFPEYA